MKLTKRQKEFLVALFAAGETASSAAKAFREEFGAEIPRQIAHRYNAGVPAQRRSLSKDLIALFDRLKEEFDKEVEQFALSRKTVRVRNKQRRYELLERLIEARSADMQHEIAGGDTGLLVRDYKGKDADQPVYHVDQAVLSEMRALENDVAKELGQITDKKDITSGGKALPAPEPGMYVDLSKLSEAELEALLLITEKLHGTAEPDSDPQGPR